MPLSGRDKNKAAHLGGGFVTNMGEVSVWYQFPL